jgi:hypothetical protein
MTADQSDAIIARLAAQADALHRIEAKVTETNGRVRQVELWRAKVEGMTIIGRNPIVVAVASGVLVAAVLSLTSV